MVEKQTILENLRDWIKKLFCKHLWHFGIDMNGNEYIQCQKCLKARWKLFCT